MDNKIDQFLLKLPDAKCNLAIITRAVMMSSAAGITESIKWNNLTFSIGKHNLAFIYSFPQTEYINLGFFNATSLQDPKKLFEGTGQGMRHIKIAVEKDIPNAQIKKWVKESIALLKVRS